MSQTLQEILILAFVLLMMGFVPAQAGDPHHDNDTGGATTTTVNNTTEITRNSGNYGLMALSASGIEFDWGVPNKLQLGAAYAFVPGGNQAISFGGAMRVSSVLVNVKATTVVDSPDDFEDDWAVVVGVVGHF